MELFKKHKLDSNKLGYSCVFFDTKKNIIQISKKLLHELDIKNPEEFKKLIPNSFFYDIYDGDNSIFKEKFFTNYRIWLLLKDKKITIMFSIDGYLNDENVVCTLWQNIDIDKIINLNYQSAAIDDVAKIQNLIQPFVPEVVIKKAKEFISYGREGDLDTEIRVATVMFADIVGFTQKSEKMDSTSLLEMLNLTFNVLVKKIDRNKGYVDKFMGDAVMAIFENPLAAVLAAVEIQTQFLSLNELRELSDQEPINVRIGINTGKVIVGSIGIDARKDWTAIGDVVNIAARIEKHSKPGAVLISDTTYQHVKDRVKIADENVISVKGKEIELKVMFVKSVTFLRQGESKELSLNS
jgi:class 3 adenylate cyclase